MPLRLRVIPTGWIRRPATGEAPTTERIVEFEDNVDEIRIGRRPDVELSLPFKALSGLHARLRRKGSGGGERGHTWVIEDLESKNGTFVGKSRIKPGEQRLLFAGDKVDLARGQGDVRRPFAGDPRRGRDGDDRAPAGERPAHGVAGRERADAVGDSGASKEIESLKLLDRDRPYFIGRRPELRPVLPSRGAVAPARVVQRGPGTGWCCATRGRRTASSVNGIVVTVQRLSERGRDRDGAAEAAPDGSGGQIPARARRSATAPERAPRGEAGPQGAVVMPAALAVSLPPTPTPPAARADPEAGRASQGVAAGAPPRPAGHPMAPAAAPARRDWNRGWSSTSNTRR